jgi:hypothetical protein
VKACVPVKPPEKLLNSSRNRKRGVKVRSESKARGTRDMILFVQEIGLNVGYFGTVIKRKLLGRFFGTEEKLRRKQSFYIRAIEIVV